MERWTEIYIFNEKDWSISIFAYITKVSWKKTLHQIAPIFKDGRIADNMTREVRANKILTLDEAKKLAIAFEIKRHKLKIKTIKNYH